MLCFLHYSTIPVFLDGDFLGQFMYEKRNL